MEKVHYILLNAGLPMSFYDEAMSIAYHSMNYSPPIVIGKKTPHQVWSCKPVDCSNDKLESTFMKCIFLGYNPKVRGYKL